MLYFSPSFIGDRFELFAEMIGSKVGPLCKVFAPPDLAEITTTSTTTSTTTTTVPEDPTVSPHRLLQL